VVWRGGGGGTFYRIGRRWRGGEEAGGGGVLIPIGLNELRGTGGRATLFQWGSDGGWTALQFGSLQAEEGVASGGARHGNAGRAVGGGSGDGPNRPVRPNGPTRQLGWRRVLGQNQESE
jgi:hypothetical protein